MEARDYSLRISQQLKNTLYLIAVLATFEIVEAATPPAPVERLYTRLEQSFKRYGWNKLSIPRDMTANFARFSAGGWPLVSYETGSPELPTVLLMCTVHGDEISTAYFCFRWLQEKVSIPGHRVVVAPLVNPDGFFKRTRANLNKVDLNRNFPTKDFQKLAVAQWKKDKADPRKFPGNNPASETETIFQMRLLEIFKPVRVVSVHAPLKFLDYDGPTMAWVERAQMERAARTAGVPLKSFRTYPGSLGRYAGEELKIPTFTLEFPDAEASKASNNYLRFRQLVERVFVEPIRIEESKEPPS